MANISLAEAVKLKSVLSKRIHELEEEMDRVAYQEVEKGSKVPKQARTLKDAEADLDEIRKDFRTLDRLMYEANIGNTVEFGGESFPIVEAIELATQLRAKARKYKEYGSAQKEEYPYAYSENNSIIRLAMFEPEEYRLKAIEMDRQANRLSNQINAKNYSVELKFDSEKYF
ncbi:hypothetical protein CEF21_05570 [Bacillus sp. FJAT-42376]|uniref:hypothetical protein n=1 Tax=Bacillus sp. FJAT-42376 TaxID=2014076 RepID=UPI000F514363|nr:hypothetical protein [Bacillus sp. FJAT-42376]AZB41814.1 hypothetical protein CEF21_05570 [Bacillus sp. FJAT-42376]